MLTPQEALYAYNHKIPAQDGSEDDIDVVINVQLEGLIEAALDSQWDRGFERAKLEMYELIDDLSDSVREL